MTLREPLHRRGREQKRLHSLLPLGLELMTLLPNIPLYTPSGDTDIDQITW